MVAVDSQMTTLLNHGLIGETFVQMNIVPWLQLTDLLRLNAVSRQLRATPAFPNRSDLGSRRFVRALFARPNAAVADALPLSDLAFWERLAIRTARQRQAAQQRDTMRCANHSPREPSTESELRLACDRGFPVTLCQTCIHGDDRAACIWDLDPLCLVTHLTPNTLKNRLPFMAHDSSVFHGDQIRTRRVCDRRRPILPVCFLRPQALAQAVAVSKVAQADLVDRAGAQWVLRSVCHDKRSLAMVDFLAGHPSTGAFISCPVRRFSDIAGVRVTEAQLTAARHLSRTVVPDTRASSEFVRHIQAFPETAHEMMARLRRLLEEYQVEVAHIHVDCFDEIDWFFAYEDTTSNEQRSTLRLELYSFITGLPLSVCPYNYVTYPRSMVRVVLTPCKATRRRRKKKKMHY
jgi:hypothetical protein